MDRRFWLAFFAGALITHGIIFALVGNLVFATLMGVFGVFEIWQYGVAKEQEEEAVNGDEN